MQASIGRLHVERAPVPCSTNSQANIYGKAVAASWDRTMEAAFVPIVHPIPIGEGQIDLFSGHGGWILHWNPLGLKVKVTAKPWQPHGIEPLRLPSVPIVHPIALGEGQLDLFSGHGGWLLHWNPLGLC